MSNLGDVMKIDLALCAELDKLIEKLTTSGKPELDPQQLKEVKKICKQSDDYVRKCFHLLMVQLEKSHSEIRLSALQLCNELFVRSHCFRDQILVDFQYFMELVLETNSDFPLPAPKKVSKVLKSTAAKFIHQWTEKFGDVYKKLTLGYHYLRDCKKINFQDIEVRTEAERRHAEERQNRLEQQQRERIQRTDQEMTDIVPEIQTCLTQGENCLALLLPDLDNFDIQGLKSPEIFRKSSPWKRQKSSSSSKSSSSKVSESKDVVCKSDRHVNKSTKNKHKNTRSTRSDSKGSKSESGSINLDIVKVEHSGMDVSHTSSTSTNKEVVTMESEPTQSSKEIVTMEIEDVKPSKAELDKSMASYQETLNKTKGADIDVKMESSGCEILSSHDERKDSEDKLGENNTEMSMEEQSVKTEDQQEEEMDENEDEDNEDEDITEDEEEPDSNLRGHGLTSQSHTITLSMDPDHVEIQETTDNEDILRTLRDCVRLIDSKFYPVIGRWLEVIAKNGADESRVKRALDAKQALQKLRDKINRIHVVKMTRVKPRSNTSAAADSEDSDSDADFEEVATKEGLEARIPDELREEYGLVEPVPLPPTNPDWSLKETISKEADDPTTLMATVKAMKSKLEQDRENSKERDIKPKIAVKDHPNPAPVDNEQPSTSSGTVSEKKTKDEAVPLIPFGTDLFHWGQKIETPLMANYREHRFMGAPTDSQDVVDQNALASMKSRVINYTGKFEPVRWKCLAPMPNGTLCQRMDRVKCPFHGKIIPRNAVGQPTNEEDVLRIKKEEEERKQEETPDWDDPEFQRDLKAATGIDLERKGRGKGSMGKGKKGKPRPKKYPGLTDVNKVHNTTRRRLEGKVLSRQAMRRVANAQNAIDAKRRNDKFGNSFNYVHSKKSVFSSG